MISDVEKTRPKNGMLVSRDRNCKRMTAGNISGHTPHQCGVSTAIEGLGLVYWEVGKVRW